MEPSIGPQAGGPGVVVGTMAGRNRRRRVGTLIGGGILLLVAVCLLAGVHKPVSVQLLQGGKAAVHQDVEDVVRLTESRKKYESAKARVAALHAKFDKLQRELGVEVQDLDESRSDLVNEMQHISSRLGISDGISSSRIHSSVIHRQRSVVDVEDVHNEHESVPLHAGSSMAAAAAVVAKDSADAAWSSLQRTLALERQAQDAASHTEQLERNAEAARQAMREAVIQSGKMVDYNAEAVQTVSEGAQYVSSAADAVRGYVKTLFRAKNQAVGARSRLSNEVRAAERLVRGAASEEARAERYADQARDAADRATSAGAGLNAGVGGMNYNYYGNTNAGYGYNPDAQEYTPTAPAPYDYGATVPGYGGMRRGGYAGMRTVGYGGVGAGGLVVPVVAGAGLVRPISVGSSSTTFGGTPLTAAKELIDTVVVLMQQLTHSLSASYADCGRVQALLAYYRQHMAKYHARGASIALGLTPGDVGLVEKYAETQVTSFAANLENAVQAAARTCGVAPSSFLPDVPDINSAIQRTPIHVLVPVVAGTLPGTLQGTLPGATWSSTAWKNAGASDSALRDIAGVGSVENGGGEQGQGQGLRR